MTTSIDINRMMSQFRLASREVFNQYFRIFDPYKNDDSRIMHDRFTSVRATLFQKLVAEPASLSEIVYGDAQLEIMVKARNGGPLPAMINRDVASGYWDFPTKEIPSNAQLHFVSFFDWDQLDCQDNHYVRVQITRWPKRSEVIGKHALIEWRFVRFERD